MTSSEARRDLYVFLADCLKEELASIKPGTRIEALEGGRWMNARERALWTKETRRLMAEMRRAAGARARARWTP